MDPLRRLERERRTVEAMIAVYCRGAHGRGRHRLCHACAELAAYAADRLARCPFGVEKPTCANCPIHCYQPKRRRQVRAVMRYAGPRMVWRHPILAVRHLLDARRPPACPVRSGS
jgi:hypothetical protein